MPVDAALAPAGDAGGASERRAVGDGVCLGEAMKARHPGHLSLWAWLISTLILMTALLVNLVQLHVLQGLVIAPFALVSGLRAFSIVRTVAGRDTGES